MSDSIMDEIGRKIWYDIKTHDDGVENIGGVTVGVIGSMGAGKTTVIREICGQVRHCKDKSVQDQPMIQEGVIYVGRPLDTWLNLFDLNKEIKIFCYAPVPSYFCISKDDKLISINGKLKPLIHFYTSIYSIIENLSLHGINIIYGPPSYEITKNIVNILERRIGQKPPEEGTPCDPALWWFDFISQLVRLKNADDHYTVVCDEAHRLFPPSPSGAWWHLIQDLCESLVDLRKSNISFVLATHDTNLVDYRVIDRLNYFMWMRGSRPPNRITLITSNICGRCARGQAILEERGVEFGRGYTMRHQNSQPHVRVFNYELDKQTIETLLMRNRMILDKTIEEQGVRV